MCWMWGDRGPVLSVLGSWGLSTLYVHGNRLFLLSLHEALCRPVGSYVHEPRSTHIFLAGYGVIDW